MERVVGREPGWLHLPAAVGTWRELRLPARALRSDLIARVWSPAGADRVLVAHDGPDYEAHAGLSRYAAATVAAGRVRPFHLVLLPAGERSEWYSAAAAYSRALTGEILPRIAAELNTAAPVVGAGASLGALAMLAAQRHDPQRFAGLFLQSGSFFQQRLDSQESGFARYRRIVRFVGKVRRAATGPAVPVAMTCGKLEENLANNRSMAEALRGQGYPVTLTENHAGHDWAGWRDALDPPLTKVLAQAWS
jgi:enterochelin esterase family protein